MEKGDRRKLGRYEIETKIENFLIDVNIEEKLFFLHKMKEENGESKIWYRMNKT